jgi:hypothetical protein
LVTRAQPSGAPSALLPKTLRAGRTAVAWDNGAVSSYRHQAHLEAPLEEVWGLVATPDRYPEWWPRVIEVNGERFEEGDEWAQVTQEGRRRVETNFLLEKREDLREIRMSCQLTGAYVDWRLTPAQGGTFVDLEMGIQPKRLADRLFSVAIGRSYFRRWSKESLEGLSEAASAQPDRS